MVSDDSNASTYTTLYNTAIDIWSAGLIFLEMYDQKPLFDYPETEITMKITEKLGKIPHLHLMGDTVRDAFRVYGLSNAIENGDSQIASYVRQVFEAKVPPKSEEEEGGEIEAEAVALFLPRLLNWGRVGEDDMPGCLSPVRDSAELLMQDPVFQNYHDQNFDDTEPVTFVPEGDLSQLNVEQFREKVSQLLVDRQNAMNDSAMEIN